MTALGVGEGGLRLHDVYLEGVTDEGTALVGHLSVIVDGGGITVLGPSPGAKRVVGWDRLSSVELGPPATLPGGASGSSLELVVDGRPLRLLVPTATAAVQPPPAARAEVVPPAEPLPPVAEDGAGEPAPAPPHAPEPVVPAVEAAMPAPEPTVAPAEPTVAPAVAPAVAPVEPAVVAGSEPEAHEVWDGASGAETEGEVDGPTAPLAAVVPPAVAELQAARLVRPRAPARPPLSRAQHLVRVTVLALVVALVLVGATIWMARPGAGGPTGRSPVSDAAIAARVGIQRGELPGWAGQSGRVADVFAAGATTRGRAASRTAARASTVLARCLHVSVAALDSAFDMGSAAQERTARSVSRLYGDPEGDGGAISSVVDVVRSDGAGRADAAVFADPSLFATCYQPYVQAMLPFAPGAPRSGFATATVQPTVVPVPSGSSDVEVAAFQIARIGNDDGQSLTTVTTAVAVVGGRVLATVDATSDLVFPLDTEDAVVQQIEARVLGVSLL